MRDDIHLEILSIGDELLLGIRDNTHLTFLGEQLTRHGLAVERNTVFRDDPDTIRKHFSEAWERADVVITTGGLGPTPDDMTREAIAGALGVRLMHDKEVEAAIRRRFEKMGRVMSENNLRQANIPAGACAIPNAYGTAPGIWFERDGKTLIMLPGPSNELRPMFMKQVMPILEKRGLATKKDAYLQLRTFGIGESALEEKLSPIFRKFEGRLRVGYCAHAGMVDVRLSPETDSAMSDAEVEAIAETCREILGDDFACFGRCCLGKLVLGQLRTLGKTLAVAESCTGGMLSNAFTDIPGASKVFKGGVVCYANSAKTDMLDVPEEIIQQHGAVSAECAVALATGAAERFGADYALSVTGFAGPGGGSEDNPVGTIYLGYHSPVGVWSRKLVYNGNRLQVKKRAVNASLDWMRRKLLKYKMQDVLSCMEN